MLSENVRKQLRDFKRQGKSIKYCINYIIDDLIEKDADFEKTIIKEMKKIGFDESEVVECLEYDFGFDLSWIK